MAFHVMLVFIVSIKPGHGGGNHTYSSGNYYENKKWHRSHFFSNPRLQVPGCIEIDIVKVKLFEPAKSGQEKILNQVQDDE